MSTTATRVMPTRCGIALAGERGEQVVDGHVGHPRAGAHGGRADVRDDEQVRRVEQRVVGRQRLGVGDVERRRRRSRRSLQRLRAARPGRPTPPRAVLIEVAPSASCARAASAPIRWRVSRRQRRVQGDEVGAARAAPRAAMPGRARAVDDLHAEALAAARHRLADAAPADDPERRAGEVAAEHVRRVPRRASRPSRTSALALGEPAGDGEQQRERDVGGRVGQHVGRVADRDAALARPRRGRCCRCRRRGSRSPRTLGAASSSAASTRSVIDRQQRRRPARARSRSSSGGGGVGRSQTSTSCSARQAVERREREIAGDEDPAHRTRIMAATLTRTS